MALKKCKECGGQVSNKAKACPACGAPVKKSSTASVFLLLVVVFIGYNLLQVSSISSPPPRAALTEPSQPIQVSIAVPPDDAIQVEEYFYCGHTNLDGTAQDYSKWGKGTDFIYSDENNRWEWVTDYEYQYIYPDGRDEQKARVAFFDDQKGVCNSEMEQIYKKRLEEIVKSN